LPFARSLFFSLTVLLAHLLALSPWNSRSKAYAY
jgi:hypothetical protein